MIRNVKSDFCPALTQSCFIKIAVSFKHNIIVACDFSVLCFAGSKPFMCKICNFATAQLGDARNHVKRHLGMREYKCDICGWVTRSMPFLRVTIRRVEGVKQRLCSHKFGVKDDPVITALDIYKKKSSNNMKIYESGNVFVLVLHLMTLTWGFNCKSIRTYLVTCLTFHWMHISNRDISQFAEKLPQFSSWSSKLRQAFGLLLLLSVACWLSIVQPTLNCICLRLIHNSNPFNPAWS